jgi:hypothetical protein
MSLAMADHDTPATGKHLGPARTSPYPVSRMAPSYDLVHLARQVQEADRMVGSVVGGKLETIAEQIRQLQEQAREVLVTAKRDVELHHAQCNFVKRPGKIYHVYRRAEGTRYLSMLSPEDWGGRAPHAYEGSYRLDPDQSWVPVDEITAPPRQPEELVRRLLEVPALPSAEISALLAGGTSGGRSRD